MKISLTVSESWSGQERLTDGETDVLTVGQTDGRRARHNMTHLRRAYKKIVYNIYALRQNACLVVNPIKVNNFSYLLDCITVGRASD